VSSERSPVTRDAAGRLVLPQPFPFAGRIFGALFALPGFKLLWDFIAALIEVGRAGAWQITDILGFGVWLVFTLVFLLPGWAIATIRRRVVVDRTARELLQTNDFLVYRWTSRRSLNDFDGVRLFLPPRTSSSSTRASCHVEMHAGRKSVILLLADDAEEARRVGREVAEYAVLPLRDEIRDDGQEEEEN
jgi:hypothetical protein